jgi:PST family polysaccharide transporter
MNNFLHGLYERMAWRAGLDILSRGSFLIVNLLIARTLSVSDFGKLGYALSFAQIFYTVADLGTGSQLMKEMGEFRERANLWIYYLKLRLALLAGGFVIFLALPWFVWRWDHPWLMHVMLLVVFTNSLLDFSQFVCNGLARMDLARRTLFIQRGCAITGIVVPLIAFPSLTGIVIGMGVGSVIGAASSLIVLWKKSENKWATTSTTDEWRRIMKLSVPNAISNALGMWYLRIAPLVLGWVASSHALGEYNGALRIYEATYIIPASVMAIALPHLSSALKQSLGSYENELRRVGLMMIPFGIGWACFLGFGSPWIVRLLLGPRFDGAIPVLSVLGLAGGMVFVNYFVTYPMLVVNAQRRHAFHQTIVFLFSLSAHLYLIRKYSAVGAAWALLSTEIVLFLLTASYLARWHHRRRST